MIDAKQLAPRATKVPAAAMTPPEALLSFTASSLAVSISSSEPMGVQEASLGSYGSSISSGTRHVPAFPTGSI